VSEKGWVGWVVQNKLLAGGVAASLVLVASGLAVVASRSDKSSDKAANVETSPSTAPGETSTSVGGESSVTTAVPGTTGASAAGRSTVTTRKRGAVAPPTGILSATPCTPKAGYTTKGLTDKKVTVGNLFTESNVLPQQFKPANEGVQAAIKLINDNGGVCGRTIELKALSDSGLQPTGPGSFTDNWNTLKGQILAWVGSNSLRDGDTYQNDAPFDQNAKDGNEIIPDIGGLALSYNRSQSPWHAGTVGSISPSLVGGGAFKDLVDDAAAGRGTGKGACKGAGFLYLMEPTGASSDSAMLGGIATANKEWGAGLSNVHYYQQQLAASVQQYEATVQQMVANGDNCVFTYADLQSNINLVEAMRNQGVWPPTTCNRPGPVMPGGQYCFSVTYIPFAGYDPKFYTDAGTAADGVSTFIPHVPLNETSDASMSTYLNALRKYVPSNSGPGSFSIIGYSAGLMFAKILGDCGAAPTRACISSGAKGLANFNAGGLIGAVTPFKSTRVNCSSGCGNFSGRGTYDFKWIFTCNAYLRVGVQNGKRDFYRYDHAGYKCDTLHVARGTPA
jgi:hypothetical protein